MDNKAWDEFDLQHAIDAQFSSITKNPELYRNVLRQARGEIVVKKKISFILVFILMLVLIMATALAASVWHTFFEPVVTIEAKSGSFATWTLKEKLMLLDLMIDNGIQIPTDKLKQLSDDSVETDKKEQMATEIIVDQYGREDALSHIDIMEDVKGPIDTWSLEDKAWYSQLMQKYGRLGDDKLNILPGAQDLTKEKAVEIAAQALSAARGISLSASQIHSAYVSYFVCPAADVEHPRWLVEFEGYKVLLTKSGEVTEDPKLGILSPVHEMQREAEQDLKIQEQSKTIAEMEKVLGPTHTWSLKDKLVISQSYRLPAAGDLSEEEAITKAKEALIEAYGVEESVLDQYTPYVWLERGNRNKDKWEYIYRIDFGTVERPHIYGVIMMSETGEILETYCPADTVISNG